MKYKIDKYFNIKKQLNTKMFFPSSIYYINGTKQEQLADIGYKSILNIDIQDPKVRIIIKKGIPQKDFKLVLSMIEGKQTNVDFDKKQFIKNLNNQALEIIGNENKQLLFVDFEFINQNGEYVVFNIGCSFHNKSDKFFKSYFSHKCENILDEWLKDVNGIMDTNKPIQVLIWSTIEETIIKRKFPLIEFEFVDLSLIFKNEDVSKYFYNFKLKHIVEFLHEKGLIGTSYDSDGAVGNGLECLKIFENIKNKEYLTDNDRKQIENIKYYNYKDVKVMEEIFEHIKNK
jgi:hypothetical protein